MGFITGMQECFSIYKSINRLHHINRIKKKSWSSQQMQKKHLMKFIILSWWKLPTNLVWKGAYFNIILYDMSRANTILQQWKAENFFSKIKNKTGVSTLTSTIHNSIWSPSQSNQARKRNKKHQIGKEGLKVSLFADDMCYTYTYMSHKEHIYITYINMFLHFMYRKD